MASTIDELNHLYPEWNKIMTWNDFGRCTQEDLNDLKKKWFTDPEYRVVLQGIWNRHPLRQTPGKFQSLCFPAFILLSLFLSSYSVVPQG